MTKQPMYREVRRLPYTGLQWAIRVLEVIVFETVEGGVGNGESRTGKVRLVVYE